MVSAVNYNQKLGYDYPFNDIVSYPFNRAVCEEYCTGNPDCVGYVTGSKNNVNICWLKSIMSTSHQNSERIAYIKEFNEDSKIPTVEIIGLTLGIFFTFCISVIVTIICIRKRKTCGSFSVKPTGSWLYNKEAPLSKIESIHSDDDTVYHRYTGSTVSNDRDTSTTLSSDMAFNTTPQSWL